MMGNCWLNHDKPWWTMINHRIWWIWRICPMDKAISFKIFQSLQGEGEDFDAKQLHQHSQQLLHFLRQYLEAGGDTGGFPLRGVLQNGWFIVENPLKIDDLDWFGGTTIFRKPPYGDCDSFLQAVPKMSGKKPVCDLTGNAIVREEPIGYFERRILPATFSSELLQSICFNTTYIWRSYDNL